MGKFEEIFESIIGSPEDKFDVVQTGGSIDEKSVRSKSDLKGLTPRNLEKLFNTEEEAKEKAKRLNKLLSPGEKSYYKIKYVVARVGADGKYTGK